MRKVFLAIIVLFILAILILSISHRKEAGFRITVHNNLVQTISHLVLTYPNGSKEFEMEPRSVKTIQVHPKKFGEGSINFIYNERQVHQEIMVFGYIENGYNGRAEISIDSVSVNGELQVTVQEKTNLY
jgi:hypothetical protein